MVKKTYHWMNKPEYELHTQKKHTLLREYFRQYLLTRCKHPQQSQFRIALVDAFSGAGIYSNEGEGSPFIFIKTLQETAAEINVKRQCEELKQIKIDCLLIFNDADKATIRLLQQRIDAYISEKPVFNEHLQIKIIYMQHKFEEAYPKIKEHIQHYQHRNVFFNLDQCGHTLVSINHLTDIMRNWQSAEVLLTFMIQPMLNFIKNSPTNDFDKLSPDITNEINKVLTYQDESITRADVQAECEKIIYNRLSSIAPYTSPFAIHHPDGWNYWLMHFANNYRARQVYNDILYKHGESQVHCGHSGLNMLSYTSTMHIAPSLFIDEDRERSVQALHNDIPELITKTGDIILMLDFFQSAYSATPAHSDDINKVLIDNPDIQVLTDNGKPRRKYSTIKTTDTIKLNRQTSMFFMYSDTTKKKP